MKKVISVFLMVLCLALTLCGCSASVTTEGYSAKDLVTENGSDGWKCTFSSLEGEYTNGFVINSKTLNIQSQCTSGGLEIVLSANGVEKSFDGKNYDGDIDVTEFGDGYIYVTLNGTEATDGTFKLVWH